MLNLYPERSSGLRELSGYDRALSVMYCAAIERVLLQHGATDVLGAWGNMPHATLKRAKVDVQGLLDRTGIRVFTWDPPTTQGNPHHPSPSGRPLAMFGPKRYLS